MTQARPAEEGETYPALRGLRVFDAMHHGLVSCPVDAPLRTVARMMATHRVHAILVVAHGDVELPGGYLWGIISDADLLHAAQAGDLDEETAETIAAPAMVTVRPHDDLRQAARIMVDQAIAHVIVTDPRSSRPVGVLSRLDVARALAGFPERHPVPA